MFVSTATASLSVMCVCIYTLTLSCVLAIRPQCIGLDITFFSVWSLDLIKLFGVII